MPNPAGWNFDNSYARLPDLFFVRQGPVAVSKPEPVIFNEALAKSLGLSSAELAGSEGAAIFAGNALPPGAEPIAQAYAGHQFGHLNMLGDGRAILLGEQLTPSGGRFDIQLKGSGPTPFSRRGDGRAALGPMLREYVISEAMFALGIPTTRSLAVVATGEPVFREVPAPGAVLTRVAASHLRVGTFVYAAGVREGGAPALATLADYAIERHYPDLSGRADRYAGLLRAVIDRQASLVARWMAVGFLHGVMNTDNVAISGETIDYGPCAFLDAYAATTVFSSIDRNGRYAFGNQPKIAAWNLARLAEALAPILAPDANTGRELAQACVLEFPAAYERHYLTLMRAKLGLARPEEGDAALVAEFLAGMEKAGADFTNTFRELDPDPRSERLEEAGETEKTRELAAWRSRWRARLEREGTDASAALTRMHAHNPAVIARNHQVETALAAAEGGDLGPLHGLLAALAKPFEQIPAYAHYRQPALVGAEPYRTFCGT